MKTKQLILITIILCELLLGGCSHNFNENTTTYVSTDAGILNNIRDGEYTSIKEALNSEIKFYEDTSDLDSLYYICEIASTYYEYYKYREKYYDDIFENMPTDEALLEMSNQYGPNIFLRDYLDISLASNDGKWLDVIENSSEYSTNLDFEVQHIAPFVQINLNLMTKDEIQRCLDVLLQYDKKYNKKANKMTKLILYKSIYIVVEEQNISDYMKEYEEKFIKQYKKVYKKEYDGDLFD